MFPTAALRNAINTYILYKTYINYSDFKIKLIEGLKSLFLKNVVLCTATSLNKEIIVIYNATFLEMLNQLRLTVYYKGY